MLWLCLHLPRLPLEIFSQGDATPEPVIVSDGRGRRPRVWVANAAAQGRGVRAGLDLAAAYALVEGLRVHSRHEGAELAALRGVAAWAGQFTSLVALTPPEALLLEIGASLKLFGGLKALCTRIEAGIEGLGYTAQWAVAPTPLAAHWLACKDSGHCVTGLRAVPSALAGLPLGVMSLSEESAKALRRMGVHTIGDCLRLPRQGLARRIHPSLPLMLDKALGRAADPRPAFASPPRFDRRLPLTAAVTQVEALSFGIQRLITELNGALQGRCAGVQTLELRLFHHRRPATLVSVALIQPRREIRHLMAVLRERLERVSLPAPVEEIALSSGEFLSYKGETPDMYPGTESARSERGWGTLVERLRARLGEEAVRGLCLVAEHRPERAWRVCEPGAGGPAPDFGPRPLWLLDEPVPLSVMHGRPYLGGVLTLEGEPERIESGWWDGGDIARDYYIAYAVNGSRFWVYRELRDERRWFLHGVFG